MPKRQIVRLTSAFATIVFALSGCSEGAGKAPARTAGSERIVRAERPVPDHYLVRLAPADAVDAAAVAQELAGRHGGVVLRVYAHALRGFAVRASAAAAAAIALDPRVERVEEDAQAAAAAVAWQLSPPWNLDRVDQPATRLDGVYTLDDRWTGAGVNAYVLDTGVLTSHLQFYPGRATFAFDALGESSAGDCSGHGTHVAGTLGGGTSGVAKGVRLHSVRVLDCDGNGLVSNVVAGIDWVIANHVHPAVANLSVFSGASPTLDDAVEAAVAHGIVVVAAAGDGGKDACDVSPARTPGAIAVAAMEPEAAVSAGGEPRDVLAPYSNVGDCVDLVAPGTNILSAWNGSIVADLALSGTSMAAPHVAGAVALYLSRYPAAAPDEVARALVAASTRAPVGAPPFTPDRLLFTRAVELPPAVDPDAAVTISAPLADAELSGTVTVSFDVESAVSVTRVELLVDGRWRGTDDTPPYELAWDSATSLDGTHALVARAYDMGGNAIDSAPVSVTLSNPGAAHLDAALRIARCETLAASCDSRDLVRGRGALRPERYAPTVLRDPCDADPAGCLCQDGPTGAYLVDESVERVVVTGAGGTPLATGGNVRIDVDVFVGADLGDFLDLYASPAVSPPAWRHLITLQPVASGHQTLTAHYTLPAGGTQAVRAAFRYGGAAAICTDGGYDDRDDLAFEVGPGTEDTVGPTVAILAPSDGEILSGTSDVEVDAQDDRLVSKVVVTAERHFGSTTYPVAQLTSPPYRSAWRSALLPNGAYTLRAVAHDGAGQTATDEIEITLADLAGPDSAILSPDPDAVLTSNLVHVEATASDAGVVKKLEVLVDGVQQGTDGSAPWGFEFRVPANGDYVLALRGTDLQGNVAESALVTVHVNDVKPPVVRVLRPADQAVVTGVVTFELEAEDESGIGQVLLYFDGELVGTATGAPYSMTWDSSRAPNGSYVFAATVVDGVENVATTSVTVKRNDLVPPTVRVTEPLPDAVLAGTVAVAASASDDSAVQRVDFLLYDPVAMTSTIIGTDDTNPHAIVWATGSVAPGTWEIYARAWDYAGNEATSDPAGVVTVTVAGDSTPPATAIVAPSDGLEWVTGPVRVAATADDPTGHLVKVELRVDGVPFATFTAPPFEAILDTTTLANGVRELTSKAYDLAGNAAVSAPVTISVSNPGAELDPAVGVPACNEPRALCHTGLLLVGRGPLGPEASAPNTIDGCPDGMQGEYGVDESIEHVAISSLDGGELTGGKLARIDVRAVIADPAYDRLDVYAAEDPAAPEFVLVDTFPQPTVAGEQALSVTVPLLGSTRQVIRVALRGGGDAEACGTTGYDDRDDVVIAVHPGVPDTTPPEVAITSPDADEAVRSAVTVVAAATDDVGVTRVEFRVNGLQLDEDRTAPYEARWDPAGLVPTTYRLTAVAYDLAGNWRESAPVSVRVEDVVFPTCAITSPVHDDTVTGTVAIQATASDDVGVMKVELLRIDPAGNGTVIASDPSAPYAFSMGTSALQDGGTYRLVARAHDAGGNYSDSAPVAIHVTRSGLAAWDKTLKAPKCATAGIQCWTAGLVVGRGPLGPESKAPNTIGSTCADGAAGYFHLDESSEAIAVRAVDLANGLKEGAAVRIEVKVWATASYPTDRLDVFVAPNAKAPVWTLVDTLTPTRAGPQVLVVDHVLQAGSLQAVRAQLRHAGEPAGGCSPGQFDERDDLVFAVSR
jgi:subtilisin family serine protease